MDDYDRIAEAVAEARRVQEFIWANESRVLRPYNAEEWRALFQKRVDSIAEIDTGLPGAWAMLRKRLLQQAALSIKAMAVLDRVTVDGEQLHDEMEPDAMIDTIKELEKDRGALLQVARMALQQLEFTYGKRKRRWDAEYLMRRLETTIAESTGSGEFAAAAPLAAPTHRCNGVNGAERHGTQNKCTICGEYRNGWFDSNGMEVRGPSTTSPDATQDEQNS